MTEIVIKIVFQQPIRAPPPKKNHGGIEAPNSRLRGMRSLLDLSSLQQMARSFDPQGWTNYSNRLRSPQQTPGNALAPGFIQQNPPIVEKA